MQPHNIQITTEAVLAALSVKLVILLLASILFLFWTWGEIVPALEHIMLSMRTASLEQVPEIGMKRLSETLVPFGLACSKLIIIGTAGIVLSVAAGWAEGQSYDWDANIKTLKRARKQKYKTLAAEIDRIERLHEKANVISSAAKDLEVVADKVKRLKFEASKPLKTKNELGSTADKTAELFVDKPKGKPRPVRTRAHSRPEF